MPRRTDQSHKRSWGSADSLGLARKEDLGNTNTPAAVAARVVHEAVAPWYRPRIGDRWCEPAAGTGAFVLAMLEWVATQGVDPLDFARTFDMVEIDAEAIVFLKRRLADRFEWSPKIVDTLPIHHMPIESFRPTAPYRGIITNPPYLTAARWAETPEGRAEKQAAWRALVPWLVPRSDLSVAFHAWAMSFLAPDGASVFLSSDGWLDAEYGAPLRRRLSGQEAPGVWLERVMAWPWSPMFRDDTCPIVTVMRRTETPVGLCLIVDDRHWDPDRTTFAGATRHEINHPGWRESWMGCAPAPRRAWVTHRPDVVFATDVWLADAVRLTEPVGQSHTISPPSPSHREMQDAGILTSPDVATAIPLVFLPQGRVNRPADHHPIRGDADWPFRVRDTALDEKSKMGSALRRARHVGGVWLATAVDRLPVLFVPRPGAGAWIGSSKYLHIDMPDAAMLAAAMWSTPALLHLARNAKEGTRKTLRKDENGFAQELVVATVAAWRIPLTDTWSNDVRGLAAAMLLRRPHAVARLDQLIEDPAWVAFDDALCAHLKADRAWWLHGRRLMAAWYWRRMRNVHHQDVPSEIG